MAKLNEGRRSIATLTGIAPNTVRLRASNPWIAARNPRFRKAEQRGASKAQPGRKRRPKIQYFRRETVLEGICSVEVKKQ